MCRPPIQYYWIPTKDLTKRNATLFGVEGINCRENGTEMGVCFQKVRLKMTVCKQCRCLLKRFGKKFLEIFSSSFCHLTVLCVLFGLLFFLTASEKFCLFVCFFWYFNLVFSSSGPIHGQNQAGRETHVYFAVCGQV